MASRIRMGHSGLNQHLYNNHIEESPKCECGCPKETTEHYIFECRLFLEARDEMMGKIPNIFEHTAKVFLNGCDNYSEKINMQLLIAVTTYITRSGRFI